MRLRLPWAPYLQKFGGRSRQSTPKFPDLVDVEGGGHDDSDRHGPATPATIQAGLLPVAPVQLLCPPIDVLPDDLLYSVFLTYCDLAGSDQKFPTTASHVCRRWRRVALGAPILWSSVIVKKPQRPMEMYAERVRRSADAPLNIELWAPAFRTPSTSPKHLAQILDVLIPESSRWKTLKVSVTNSYWEAEFPDDVVHLLFDRLRDTNLPQLESLMIRLRWSVRSLSWTFQAFQQGMPRLRRVDLAFSSVSWSSPLLHNLQILRLGAPEQMTVNSQIRHLLEILLHSSELQSLTVYPTKDHTLPTVLPNLAQPNHDLRSISHSHLAYLDITPPLLHVLAPFLNELPALRTLRLVCSSNGSDPTDSSIQMDRIAPGLERLIIDASYSFVPFVPQLHLVSFSTMTSITSAEFANCRFTSEGWATLGDLCPPRMQAIAFVNCNWYSTAQLKKLVTDRTGGEGVFPLRKLVLEHYPPSCVFDDDLAGFLKARGVDSNVSKPWTIDRYKYARY